jgi:hypothetical protein
MVKLTMQEALKLEVTQRVMDRKIDTMKAGKILGFTNRSIYRLLSKVLITSPFFINCLAVVA